MKFLFIIKSIFYLENIQYGEKLSNHIVIQNFNFDIAIAFQPFKIHLTKTHDNYKIFI